MVGRFLFAVLLAAVAHSQSAARDSITAFYGQCSKGQAVDTPPAGTFDAQNQTVTPSSLYLEQLRQRLGEAAVKAIGY